MGDRPGTIVPARRRRFDVLGSLALLGNIVCWGATPAFLKYFTGYVDAWAANGLRYPFSAVLYWPVLAWAWRKGTLTPSLWRRALEPAAFSFVGQVFWALAPYYLPASLVGFLVRSSIIWGVAGALALFPEERALLFSRRFRVGLAVAIAGFIGLSFAKVAGHAPSAPAQALGIAIILACACCFGLYGVSVRRCMREVHPIIAFAVVSQPVALGCLALMPCSQSLGRLESLEPRIWVLIGLSSIIGIASSHVFYYASIQRLGAAIASSGNLASAFVAAAFASLFLGERLAPAGWIWGWVLVAGGALIVWAQEKVHVGRAAPD